MSKIKRTTRAIIVFITLVVFGGIVQQSQILYGGYENMLYRGLAQIFNEDVVELKGSITLNSPRLVEDNTASLLKLEIEGEISFKNKEGHIDFYILDPFGSKLLKIGSLYEEMAHYYLKSEIGDVEPILLDKLIEGIILEGDGKADIWDEMYKEVVVTNSYFSESGKSGEIRYKRSINYTFDLLKLLDQSLMIELSNQVGFNISLDKMNLVCHLDELGQIVSVELMSEEIFSMEVEILVSEKKKLGKLLKTF